MADKSYLCALDLPDTLPLSPQSPLRINGWVLPTGGAQVRSVSLRINGAAAVPTTYPQLRPDVKTYYAQFENAERSGFVTSTVELAFGQDRTLDLEVIVDDGADQHVVHTRQVQVRWFDPEREVFRLGQVAPFEYPESFAVDRLPTFADAPVFIVGSASQVQRAASELQARGKPVASADGLMEMLKALTACHDAYAWYDKNIFVHFRDRMKDFAIGRYDFYRVADAVVRRYHERYVAASAGVFKLSGRAEIVLIPLLAQLYPDARFLCLRPPFAATLDPLHELLVKADNRLRPPKDDDDPLETSWSRRSYGQLHRIVSQGPWRERIVKVGTVRDLMEQPAIWRPAPSPATRPGDRRDADGGASMAAADHLAAIEPHPQARPVFVLGAGRSGTSAMVGAMRAAGIKGYHEGHVFPMLRMMLDRVAAEVGGEMRLATIREIARCTVEQAFSEHHQGLWLNKTPDHPMIECVPLARAIYPRARFIMMRRHPVPFIESRKRKFGDPVHAAVNEWIKCLEVWKAQRATLPESCYVECDAQALRDPAMRTRLCDLLELGEEERRRFDDYLLSERPELTRVSREAAAALEGPEGERGYNLRSIFYSMLDSLGEYLEDMDWTPEQKAEVEALLGRMPEEYGYSLHRTGDRLVDLLIAWAKQLEEYRYTAENHERFSADWAAEAQRQREEAARQREKGNWLESELERLTQGARSHGSD